MIVTITPTVMDGTVLRWYDADDIAGRKPVMSVSRNRVQVHDPDAVTPASFQAAAVAYAELKRDRLADVRRFATHYRMPRAGLLPIEKEGA